MVSREYKVTAATLSQWRAAFLAGGITSSPSFIREPEGNGCAERFIRLLKENLLWVKSFATIEELRQALIEFKHVYSEQWILQRHDYKTPAQVRQEKRQTPYAEAAG